MTKLETPESESEVFAMTRRFAAPPETMWRVWTEREHLTQWWGPVGMTLVVKELVLKPGGNFLYGMQPAMGGPTHWGKFVYRMVEAPKRLVYVVSFTDENGTPVRHPMSPMWPLEVMADQRFEAVDGGTELSSRCWPINATAAERQVFQMGHASMQMGFAGTFAALESYLGKMRVE